MTAVPPKGVYDVNLPLQAIGVLIQMRARMSSNGLEDLAASIKEVGQHNPGLVVALGSHEASEYLSNINAMWGTAYALSNFEPILLEEKQDHFYLFLVAGHRRYRAIELAGLQQFYARLHFGKSFFEALLLQYHENMHEQVPPDNEARFVSLLWRRAKREKSKLTLAQFSSSLGRKPEAVRRFIRFTILPVRIQELVLPSEEYKKGIAFAILCEIARLQEARLAHEKGLSEIELMQLAYVLVTQYKTAKAVAMWVSEQIRVLEGQGDMFSLSISEAVDGARKTVSSGLEQTVRVGQEHLRVVARFHQQGGIQRVASEAAVSTVIRAIEVAQNLAPQIIEGVRGGRGAPDVRKTVRRIVNE